MLQFNYIHCELIVNLIQNIFFTQNLKPEALRPQRTPIILHEWFKLVLKYFIVYDLLTKPISTILSNDKVRKKSSNNHKVLSLQMKLKPM